ncbi:MAG TPA: hypothetical protein V6D18_00230 [Thermosynechococcaceae cyanobacterium]
MTLDWLYKLSDWNPQFFREVKGRLKPRTLMFTAIGSLLAQALVLAAFALNLPDGTQTYHHRCTGTPTGYPASPSCIMDGFNNPIVNWQGWWMDVFQALSWTLPFLLLVAGVALLINDLGKEERRGTLNFIRLSPQQSGQILLGKMLGVPIVPLLMVALALPLHLMAAILGHISALEVLGYYLVTIAVGSFFYTASLLYACLTGAQGWAGALLIWISYSFFVQTWYFSRSLQPPLYMPIKQWFYLPIGENLGLTLGFVLTTLGIGTFWLWQAVNRRFRNPSATLLSKRQSYFATLSVECFLVGFCFRTTQAGIRPGDLIILLFLNLLWFGALGAALLPHRQALLDWARYRRERISQGRRFWSRSILSDLTWDEKSPALLAIGFNLLIGSAILTSWILTWNLTPATILRAVLSLVFGSVFILLCAAIAQFLLFLPSPKRAVWATSAVGSLVMIPPIVFSVLGFAGSSDSVLWLFSVFAVYSLEKVSMLEILFSLVSQFSLLGLLTARLSRQLRKAGESESKALLAGA